MRLFILLSLLIFQAWAQSPEQKAKGLRDLIKTTKSLPKGAVERFKLPTSRGFHQKDTSLCWSYSFLNAQETIARVKDPSSTLELSRGFMQYRTMEDRILRHVRGGGTHLAESGTPLDALVLAQKFGLVEYGDYRDILDRQMEATYRDTVIPVAQAQTPEEQELVLTSELEKLFGVIPTTTHVGNRSLSPLDLSKEVLAGQDWISYAPGDAEAYGPHADTDSRPGSQSFYTNMENIKAAIYKSLKAGNPVNYTANGHVVLIYGGVYDANGKALRFFIKDSYPSYFYESDAAKVFRNLVEVTMLK